ncbi:MAG: class I SAM-dependent methyltransferase [Candidatus Hodarchaeales archaeon]|jgi:cyclopropane fatty-acyl-phospholipid synthase-like methyltransferase
MELKYDFSVKDVSDAYDGPVGLLWEVLMGDQIHVGGEAETKRLAEKLGVSEKTYLLDVCSALGGPARYLAKNYETKIVGLDITKTMLKKAQERTEAEKLTNLIEYRFGNALDIPEKSNTFDVVWGQDAWCYITSKKRLIEEVVRVSKQGGKIGFTDWILGPTTMASQEEADFLFEFMIFPNMETIEGYKALLEKNNCRVLEVEDLQEDFTRHLHIYLEKVHSLKENIITEFGEELYQVAESGVKAWVKAADERKVSRGLWIAEKL